MKKLFLILSIAGLACGAAHAQKAPRVATVDMNLVIEKYEYAVVQRSAINADVAASRNELTAIQQDLVKKEAEVRQAQASTQNDSLNEAGKANARRVFEARYNEYTQASQAAVTKERNVEANIRQRQQQMMSQIFSSVQTVVAGIAKTKGADLVLNSSFTPSGVLFADKALDVTNEVLTKLNDDFRKSGLAPVPAAPAAIAAPKAAAPGNSGLAPLPTVK